MKKKVWISIAVVSLIILLVGVNIYRASNQEVLSVETETVEKRELTGNVMVPGTLSLSQENFVYYVPENGEVAEVLVKEGDKVAEDTPLIKYENEQLQLEKEQNALSLESSYLQINRIKDQIDDLDDKEKDLKEQVGEKEAEKQIDAERDQLKTDLKVADLDARQILLQKETIENKLEDLVVKSESAGTVLTINEDAIKGISQAPILHIGNSEELMVKGTISEYDSLKINEGQAVTLRSDVLADKEWKGKVAKVSYLPVQSETAISGEETAVQYSIEVSIDDKNIEAKPGFKLIMDIETEKRSAVAVPLEAVKQDGENYYVYTVEEGKAVYNEVETGTASNEYMEIKSGLKSGSKVILNPSEEVRDNLEVNEK
ncbi:efflux RND transporter periplasmic adaptor subunit [Metabacillus halosaccharovorans]|uniref:efflux RND transporter periplasmic adaptor subunit n=1 Tax=Metabacillus halosaccharovorans TaxID=930124 RepID=UPI0037352810